MLMHSIVALFALAASAAATPLPSESFSPRIITPDASTVWTIGAVESVTWDTSTLPTQNPIPGSISLRKGDVPLEPIGGSFDLRAGIVNVTVPSDIIPGTDYAITLFGNSGDISPAFTIVAA